MPLSFFLIFLFSLIICTTTTADTPSPQPVSPALIIALEGPNASTMLFAPPPTITALNAPLEGNNDKTLPTQTITQTARVIQTHRPTDPEPIIIFPFHLTLTSHCSSSSSPSSVSSCQPTNTSATAVFQNGDWTTRLVNLGADTAATVEHRIPGFPRTLRIGPYDARTGEVRFSWRNGDEWVCGWGDGEGWRVCGECRGRGWVKAGIGEGDGEEEEKEGEEDGWMRMKEMDCSFIMGWKHQLRVVQSGAKC